MKTPDRLNLTQTPTPLQRLDRLSAELGGPTVWVKRDDLTGSVTSGNKVRKLEYTLARALELDCDMLITCGGVQSNHCRATALLGAQLGLGVHLILREEGEMPPVPDGNLFLDLLAGAEISLYPRRGFSRKLQERFSHWEQHYRKLGRNPYLIPTGASDGTGVWGYIDCAAELKEDFRRHGIAPRSIVHATGSGGTQAGLTAGAALFDLDVRIMGMAVCDDTDYFLNKVKSDLGEWKMRYQAELDIGSLQICVNDEYIGPGYSIATKEVFETIQHLAALEGLVLDPVYTGKAFHGMLEEIRRGTFKDEKDIVFVHTGGVFGLMSQRRNLLFDAVDKQAKYE